jgi:transcriptional regulator
MYIPAAFREDNLPYLHDLMRRHPFATLVTVQEGAPFASHVPVLLDAATGERGVLRTHLARSNPQAEALTEGAEALVIFHGPHAYLSPTWYETQPSVPTWNYAVVHACGTPRVLTDAELRALLVGLSDYFEDGQAEPWRAALLPDEYMTKMLRGIVGFEIAITRLEGKCKMSQNKSEADRRSAIARLYAAGDPESTATAAMMEHFLTRDRAEAR